MDELLPCPFCGGTNVIVWDMNESEREEYGNSRFPVELVVVCDIQNGGCGASWKCCADNRNAAIASWNNRTTQPSSVLCDEEIELQSGLHPYQQRLQNRKQRRS